MPLPLLVTIGLGEASRLLLLGAGAALVIGSARVANASQGVFTLIGTALCSSTWVAGLSPTAAIALGTLGAAALGASCGPMFDRLRDKSPVSQIVATAGLAIAVTSATNVLPSDHPPLDFPAWLIVGIGPIVATGLLLLLYLTEIGARTRADLQGLATDRNSRWLGRATVAAGAGLAGLAGALPMQTSVDMAPPASALIDSFTLVVVGGLGSVPGALLAALLVATVRVLGSAFTPQISAWLPLGSAAIVLLIRPCGLFGRSIARPREADPVPIHPTPLGARLLGLVLLLAVAAALLAGEPFTATVVAEAAVIIVLAGSLRFMAGSAGMPSFGPIAAFGIGMVAASSMDGAFGGFGLAAALLAGSVASALAALVLVRLPPLSVAMLSFVLAQLVWDATRPQAGLPLRHAPGGEAAAIVAVAAVVTTLLLGRIAAAPFGFALRATRDDPERAAAIGLPIGALLVTGCTLSGAAAGLAGGLSWLAGGALPIGDPLLAASAAVLGGLQMSSGSVVGGLLVACIGDLWPVGAPWAPILGGAMMVAVVLGLPYGVAGAALRFWRRAQ